MQDGRNRGDGGAGSGGAVDSVNGEVGVVELDAELIPFTPAGNISANDVQEALEELDDEKNDLFCVVIPPSATAATNVSRINAAIVAANTAGGGIIQLLEGDYPIDGSIDFSSFNNIDWRGKGFATKIKAQSGGTWMNSSVIYGEGDIRGLALGIANVTKGDTSITYSTPANAGSIVAGDVLIIQGTDAQGLADSEHHIAAANGDGGTGVVTLTNRITKTMTSVVVTDSTGNSQNNSISNMVIDGSAATDATSLIGIQASNSYRMKISRVWVVDFLSTNQEAIRVNAGVEHTLEDVYIFNCDSVAIRCAVTVGCSFRNIIIDKTNINGVSNGAIHFSFSAVDNDFQNVKISNASYDAIRIASTTSACRRMKFNGLNCSRVLGTGLHLLGGGDHQLVNGVFTDISESAVLISGSTRNILSYVANRVQFGARLTSSATYNKINAIIGVCTNDGIYSDAVANNDFSQCTLSGTFGGSAVAVNGAGYNNSFPIPITFTPTVTLVGGAGNTVPTYSTTVARYIKTNKLVTIDFLLKNNGGVNGAGSGQINIALPITVGTNQQNELILVGRFSNAAVERLLMVKASPAANTMEVFLTSVGTITPVTGADQNDGSSRSLQGSFHYEVD